MLLLDVMWNHLSNLTDRGLRPERTGKISRLWWEVRWRLMNQTSEFGVREWLRPSASAP